MPGSHKRDIRKGPEPWAFDYWKCGLQFVRQRLQKAIVSEPGWNIYLSDGRGEKEEVVTERKTKRMIEQKISAATTLPQEVGDNWFRQVPSASHNSLI